MKIFSRLTIFFLIIFFLFTSSFISCTPENEAGKSNSPVVKDDDDDNDDEPPTPLLAAAGKAIITPDSSNHPETIYLGGIFPSRLATGVHDDLLASVLMLEKDGEQVVLVSLDFLGFTRSRGREIQERVAQFGIEKEHILIASTHTHEAPDTLGVFGPDVFTSGVSRTYMRFVQDTIVDLILEIKDRLTPVTMEAATVQINDPNSNHPTLIADFRQPEITMDWLSTARFVDQDENTVATLVNWHSHPEVMIESTLVSSDFPTWTRSRVEEHFGGTCVYISGALGGLASPTGVEIPMRNEDGSPLLDGYGNQLYSSEGTWENARSLGFVIADYAIDALQAGTRDSNPFFRVAVEELLLPVSNPIMILAFYTHLVEFDEKDVVRDLPEFCGFFGCSSDRLAFVEIGPVRIVTSPGETFPETLAGREKSVVDFGGIWGEFSFPPIDGFVEKMECEVPMHMAISGNEIGYLIPASDFHPGQHPDFYEEELHWGYSTETLYSQAVKNMLERMNQNSNAR